MAYRTRKLHKKQLMCFAPARVKIVTHPIQFPKSPGLVPEKFESTANIKLPQIDEKKRKSIPRGRSRFRDYLNYGGSMISMKNNDNKENSNTKIIKTTKRILPKKLNELLFDNTNTSNLKAKEFLIDESTTPKKITGVENAFKRILANNRAKLNVTTEPVYNYY